MMAAISEDDSPAGNRIVVRLEGRVVDPYVTEIQKYCEIILAQGVSLAIDLAEVSYLDKSGILLFRKLMSQEVRLLNCSPVLNELLKSAPL